MIELLKSYHSATSRLGDLTVFVFVEYLKVIHLSSLMAGLSSEVTNKLAF